MTWGFRVWSTSNNVMQMRPANAIITTVAAVRDLPAIRISVHIVRAGIGA